MSDSARLSARLIVFTGPSLPPDEAAARLPEAVCLPPAAQGDVYRAALGRPAAIGLIDGYFEHVPAVWHKEILWAMSEGVHVLGAASMGALRAAELAAFGMEGIGQIFAWYRDGVLEDDDEVAVAHALPSEGYAPRSVALVDMRATFARAVADGIIRPEAAAAMIEAARRLFYPDRVYPAVWGGLPNAEREAFRAWLPTHAVNQKRADAIALLETLRRRYAEPQAPGRKRVLYPFHRTQMWESFVAQAGGAVGTSGLDPILDELRLHDGAYFRAYQATLTRLLAASEARSRGAAPSPDDLREAMSNFYAMHGIESEAALSAWLRENGLNIDTWIALLEDEWRLGWLQHTLDPEIERRIPDHLRMAGQYAPLAARAAQKEAILTAHGLTNPSLSEAGFSDETALWAWYFGPDAALDDDAIEAQAVGLGFADRDRLRAALLREHVFQALTTSTT